VIGEISVSDVTEYLRGRIAEVRFARFVGEIISAMGSILTVAGLLLSILPLTFTGFSLLFFGLYLSVHYELQRLDYAHALERFGHREK
jgi:hypothetical protein